MALIRTLEIRPVTLNRGHLLLRKGSWKLAILISRDDIVIFVFEDRF